MRTRVIFFILILLFLTGYTGGLWGGSWYFNHGNTYFHIAGGFFIALLIGSFYATEFRKLSQPMRFFALVSMVMAVGVLWEFHEYLLDRMVTTMKFQGDLNDTMKDLLMDTLGGIAGAIFFPKS